MHSSIIQIALKPIEPNMRIDEDTIDDSYHVDYCSDVSEQYRQEAIRDLVKRLPKAMFSLGEQPDTIIYLGGASEWAEHWLDEIKCKANSLTVCNVFHFNNLYKMRCSLDNCLDTYKLFYLSHENYNCYVEQSTAFMEFVSDLQPGTTLYIGGVLDYHW